MILGMVSDNIIPGFSNWHQPYRFVVARHTKWDPSQIDPDSVFIVDDPVTAFTVFSQQKKNDEGTQREMLFEWRLCDSFGKDALDFCKKKFENPETEQSEENKT